MSTTAPMEAVPRQALAAATAPLARTTFARDREPLPIRRTLRAYGMEARLEMLGALRTPGFSIPFLAVPVVAYLLFGVLIAGNAPAGEYGPALADYLFTGFAVMAVAMPGIFSGVLLATEREGRLLALKRAMPLPPGAAIVAKVAMAMGVSALAAALVAAAALAAGKITLSPAEVGLVWAVMVVGTVPFSAMGLLIGSLVSASAAPAYGNLLFLPMIWLSGLFIPLPAFLESWVIVWPTFHLNQLALGLAGVDQFTYVPPSLAAAVLVGFTALCGGLAVRRLARVG
jgi:ABC-2 type transport system permease protein